MIYPKAIILGRFPSGPGLAWQLSTLLIPAFMDPGAWRLLSPCTDRFIPLFAIKIQCPKKQKPSQNLPTKPVKPIRSHSTISPTQFHSNPMYEKGSPPACSESNRPLTRWSRFEDKVFENALVLFPEDLPDRWQRIAGELPGRSPAEVKEHYDDLVHDVCEIDSGRVELPSYVHESAETGLGKGWDPAGQISLGSKPKQGDAERKKGTPWTEEEHRYVKEREKKKNPCFSFFLFTDSVLTALILRRQLKSEEESIHSGGFVWPWSIPWFWLRWRRYKVGNFHFAMASEGWSFASWSANNALLL